MGRTPSKLPQSLDNISTRGHLGFKFGKKKVEDTWGVNFAPCTPYTLSPVGAAKLSARFDMETISYYRNDRKFLKYLRDLKINRGKYYCVVELSAEFETSVTLVEVRERSSFSVEKGPTPNGAEKKTPVK